MCVWFKCVFYVLKECVPEEVNLVDGWEHNRHLADTLEKKHIKQRQKY